MKFVLLTFVFAPAVVFAASFVNEPASQHTVTPIEDLSEQLEIYGELKTHPHTFEFIVKENTPFFAEVQIPKGSQYSKSLIAIKEERRGVSEVGRITYNDGEWIEVFNWQLGRSFETQGPLEAELEQGVYRVEVSSPENLGKYKLTFGTEKKWGYVSNFAQAWSGALFFGATPFAVLRAPIVLLTFVVLIALFFLGRTYWKQKHA